MAKKTEYELKIAIGGRVDNSLTQSVNEIKGQMGSMSNTIKTVVTAAATVFTTAKIKEAFDDVTDASKSMETSMAGVAKVVDGLKDENGKVTKSYHEMKNAILDLSTELPMIPENISAIMEAAGQSNIAKEELLEFTETATKMGIAFDSSAEQSGEWMAAWRTALKLNQEEVTTLADQVNYLGNTTSEDAIKLSEVITRYGSLGLTANISAASVAALAASMTKVDSNVAATGIKNFSLALVAGDSATKRQIKSYKKLGLEAKTISKNMQIDSQGTMIDVLERINKLSKDEQTSTMKDLFGSESLASIAPLVANLDNLKEQFKKVGDASLYAGSMEKEYIAASSTAANVDILTENKIQAAKIRVGDTLVSLSTLAAETKGNLADAVGGFFQENAPDIQEAIRDIEKNFNEFLPTAVKNIKSFGKETIKNVKPIFDLIDDNPDLLPKFLVATGSAMVTYKVGKNIGEIAKNVKLAGSPLKLLSGIITNPWALAIGATAGGIAFLATSIANAKKELRDADLASRFGNITLSLEDLNQVAAEMLRTDNFAKISESLDIRDGLKTLKASINESIAEMNKLGWKVGIGLLLTEEEQNLYKNSVTSFITETQELLDDNQYALNLSIDALTDDNATGKAIKESATAFYLENQKTLAELGKQLQDAVNVAFADGLLSIDEVETISNLQKQMAAITSKMAQSEFEATLEVMGTKTLGTDLTPESYKNYLAEIQEQAKAATLDYDESLKMNIANAKLRLNEGKIDKSSYNKEVEEYKKNYLENIGELNLTVSNFATDTLYSSYEKEMKSALPQLNRILNEVVTENQDEIAGLIESGNLGQHGLKGYMDNLLISQFKNIDISSEAKENILNHYKELLPTKEEIEKNIASFIEENKEIPSELTEELNNILMIGALGGDEESLYSLIGSKIGEDQEYKDLLIKASDSGMSIPQTLMESLDSEMPNLLGKVTELKESVINELEKGIEANIQADITINGKPDFSRFRDTTLYHKNFGKIERNAKGNIVTKPILTTFAEEGPEAAIPLDGSSRSRELWYTTGQMSGFIERDASYGKVLSLPDAYSSISGSNTTINNQPIIKFENTIYVESGADVQKVEQAITMSQDTFNKMMKVYEKDEGRVKM